MTTKFSSIKKRIRVNWVKLFSGSTAGAGLGLVATIIMTRSIGVADVGIVAVVQTFWRMLEQFLSFQSYQVLIKNGADIIHGAGNASASFRALVKICMMADVAMAAVGALGGTIVLALFYQEMNIPDAVFPIAALGFITMLTMVTGAFMGTLRLYDKLNAVASRDVFVGVLRILLNGLAFLLGGSVASFILIWICTEAAGNLLIIFYGWRELHKQGHKSFLSANIRKDLTIKVKSVIKALFAVNFGTMVRILSEEGDTLLVNAISGPTGAGLYKIAKNFSGVAYKFMGPLAQSIYPEIAHAVSERNRKKYKSIMLYTGIQGGLFGLVVVLCWVTLGQWVISLTVGEAYKDALPIILIIMSGYAVGFLGIGLNPSLYSFNKLKHYLVSTIACTSVYFAVALPLLPTMGITGSAYGQLACYLTGFAISAAVTFKAYQTYNWD